MNPDTKTEIPDDPLLAGNWYFRKYKTEGGEGHLYLAATSYKKAGGKGLRGLYRIRDEMKKISRARPDLTIGGPNIGYVDVLIRDVEKMILPIK